VSVNGGAPRAVDVEQVGLVQVIRIPPGDDVVTFHYRPPHLVLASVLSLGAVTFLIALLIVWLVRRRYSPDETEALHPE
jgi:hypothetical protein